MAEHNFVRNYKGPIGMGFDRKTDESTMICYCQKFSDDSVMQILSKKMSDDEITILTDNIMDLIKKYFDHNEYHKFFLEDKPGLTLN